MTSSQPRLLIGGEFRTVGSGAPIPVVNPCTGEVLWEQPACTATEVAEALAHARAAQLTWPKIHGWERGRILRAIAEEMRIRRPAIARALSLEIGRPISQAEGEVGAAIEQFEWFAGEAERLFGDAMASRQGGVWSPTTILSGSPRLSRPGIFRSTCRCARSRPHWQLVA
jgi:succinate-semialdehyde dehydrogenase / glutarate-semialdehyde dehydrogenase